MSNRYPPIVDLAPLRKARKKLVFQKQNGERLAPFAVLGSAAPAADQDPLACLTQQGQYALGQLVGLGHHRCTGLLQDLRAGQIGSFHREVRILHP